MATSRKNRTRVPKALSRKKSRKPNKSLVLSKPMKALVDKRIDAQSETKCAIHQSSLISVRGGRIIGGQLLTLIPNVPQADSSTPANRASRVGAQIRVTSIEVEGVITMVPNSTYPNAGTQLGRLIAFSSKSVREYDLISSNATLQTALANALLKNGADIDDYDGSVLHHFLPINSKDMTTHLDRKFKMNKRPQIEVGTTSTGSLHASIIPFKFRLKCKNKVLKYTDNASEIPSNYAPMIALGWCDPVNASTGQPSTAVSCDYQYQVKMNFKDD